MAATIPCLYEVLKPSLLPCKILGLFPVTCRHKNDRCDFVTSKPWLVHSLVCIAVLFFTTLHCALALASPITAMHEIISDVTDVAYGTFMNLLVVLGLARGRKFASALNKLSVITQGLLCQDALKYFRKMQRFHLIILVVAASFEYTQSTTFTVKTVLTGLVRSSTFLAYILTSCTSLLFTGVFACFEGAFSNTLRFTPVHPLDFDRAQRKPCKGNHRCWDPANDEEVLEHSRRLHENVCLVLYEMNDALGPTHLLLVLVEITTLVLRWYVLVLYVIGGDVGVFNCLYVVTHTLCLLQYLRICQLLHNKVDALKYYLLEYSTRTNDVRALLQVRLFLEKLGQYRATNACGIFDVDLRIAGPICANILTYVLVALQFDVTK